MHRTFAGALGALSLALLSAAPAAAQTCGPLLSFVEMVPKQGQEERFFDGYRRDLEFHASVRDPWTWLGWVVGNGDRRGTFVDAAACLEWTSNWTVDRALNDRLNAIHYLPHVERSWSAHRLIERSISNYDDSWMKSPSLSVYVIEVDPRDAAAFEARLARFPQAMRAERADQKWLWVRSVFGEAQPTWRLIFPTTTLVESAMADAALQKVWSQLFSGANAPAHTRRQETWRYRADLSYFPEEHQAP